LSSTIRAFPTPKGNVDTTDLCVAELHVADAKSVLQGAALELKIAAGDRRQVAITLENLAQIFALEGEGERSERLVPHAGTLHLRPGRLLAEEPLAVFSVAPGA
jgi:hypothetical protein